MKISTLVLSLLLLSASILCAQGVAINENGSSSDGSAMLDVSSTSKGFLAPRMLASERTAITSPATGLLVYQTDAPAGYYYYSGSAWIQLGVASQASQWTTTGSDIYYNSGNVGIGNPSPQYKLDISANNGRIKLAGTTGYVTTDYVNNAGSFYVGRESSAGGSIINGSTAYAGILSVQAAYPLQLATNNAVRATITGTGNVGIGTTNPTYKLEVNGNIKASHFGLDATGYFQSQIIDGSTEDVVIACDDNDFFFYERESDFYQFNIGGTAKLRVQANGYVGIGTETPSAPLHVNGYADISTAASYFNSGTSSQLLWSNPGTFYVSIRASNDIMAGGSILAASDKRVKENITVLHHSLDLIGRLRPVSYNKIDRVSYGNRLNYGFIAQEVEEVIPEAVNTGTGEIPILKPFESVEFEEDVSYTLLVKNGENIAEQKYTTKDPRPEGEIIVKSKTVDDFKSITYDMIFTVAVDAIQEQQAEIETLQQQVEILQAQNAVLSQKTEAIDQLKAEINEIKKALQDQQFITKK